MCKLKRQFSRLTMTVVMAALLVAVGPAASPQAIVTLESEYIGLGIGAYGTWEPTPPHTIGAPRLGGRFHIWVNKGDPTTEIDDGMYVNMSTVGIPGPGGKWGAWQVMVDSISADEDSADRMWCTFSDDAGYTSGLWGDPEDGFWEIAPRIPTNRNVIQGVWYPNPEGGTALNGDDGEVLLPWVRCELEARVMRDMVRFKWILKNEDVRDHLVGLRVYADLVPSGEDTGTEDLRNIISIPGYPLLENRTMLSGTEIPAMIEMFNSQTDPVHSIRMIFRGQGATPPDKVGIDDWSIVCSPAWTYWFGGLGEDPWTSWSYEPLDYDYIGDIGYGAFWKPRRLAPGQTLEIIHYLGIASSSSDFTRPNLNVPQYVASVQGPRALKYYTDDTGAGNLWPQPITITAYFLNTEKYLDMQNVGFSLTLPPGLELDPSEGGKYTKTLAEVKAGEEGKVSWEVVPVGSPTGILTYSVSFSSSPAGGTTVSRDIIIPATEYQPLSTGWQMISVPFGLSDPDPMSALGLLPGYVLYRYDAYLRQYVQADRLEPGVGYWLHLSFAQDTMMTPGEFAPIQWARTQGFQIPLDLGWNLVGNPYVYAVTLGETRFYHRDYGVLDYDQAVARGLISRTVFWWDPIFRTYRWNKYGERSVQLKPWLGYWVRALRPGVTFSITPVSQIGSGVGGLPPAGDDGGIIPPIGPPGIP